ncbi:MAG TPA: DUF2285 domain-containing protein [Methylocella sp.]|nr:DUF2285 domain-containing protein [Methylocella sp.]
MPAARIPSSKIADAASTTDTLTSYDEEHVITYLRLLDADRENADWTEVWRIVLHIDPAQQPTRARQVFDSHLARAKWMTTHHLLRRGAAS